MDACGESGGRAASCTMFCAAHCHGARVQLGPSATLLGTHCTRVKIAVETPTSQCGILRQAGTCSLSRQKSSRHSASCPGSKKRGRGCGSSAKPQQVGVAAGCFTLGPCGQDPYRSRLRGHRRCMTCVCVPLKNISKTGPPHKQAMAGCGAQHITPNAQRTAGCCLRQLDRRASNCPPRLSSTLDGNGGRPQLAAAKAAAGAGRVPCPDLKICSISA